jgi:hypothetical protein
MYCGAEHRTERTRALRELEPDPVTIRNLNTIDPEPALHGDPPYGRESSHDLEDAARIPMTEDAVLLLLRQHFTESDTVFVCPHIAPRKEMAARQAHAGHLPAQERVLALYDASPLGTGDAGFLVTARRLCWKNADQGACSIEWRDFDPDLLYLGSGQLFVGSDGITIHDEGTLDACADTFHVLALSGLPPQPAASGRVPCDRGAWGDATPAPFQNPLTTRHSPTIRAKTVATPPPAHTTSYLNYASHAEQQAPDRSCWHCKTPLYKEAPECAHCGAKPKKKGWLRTG